MDPEVCPVCNKVVYDAEGFPAGKLSESFNFFTDIMSSLKKTSFHLKMFLMRLSM